MKFWEPKAELSERELLYGLRMMTYEGMVSLGFYSITTSGFLAAFALALGASKLQIGILVALYFITQPLQIPTILLIERVRKRKLITIVAWTITQFLWFPMALIPVFIHVPGGWAVTLLLILMGIRGTFAAVANCSWNSWVRDLVPQEVLGRLYSRRFMLSSITAVIFSLGAAFFVDYWGDQNTGDTAIYGYTIALLFGALFLGMMSPVFMTQMPEPLMKYADGEQPSLLKTITRPLQDKNFTHLVRFLLFWSFASNLAIPFFAVYMLEVLKMSLLTVIIMSVISQFFNVTFLRVWGPLADRFGSKVILSLSASLYLLVILGWTFTTMPGRYFLTIPLLVMLHIFAGIATAGVTLTVATIGLKLAPEGQTTPYLAGTSLATYMGMGMGPLIGGSLADFFAARNFSVNFTWTDPGHVLQVPAFNLTGLDFLFVIAFVIGLFTLNTLSTLKEEGEVGEDVVLEDMMTRTRTVTRAVSSVPGLGFLSIFPFTYLRQVPGLNVAITVTAYQISDMARVTTLAASRSWNATANIARRLEKGVEKMLKNGEVKPSEGVDVARYTTRGVIYAGDEVDLDTRRLVYSAIVGIVRAFDRVQVNSEDAFRGAGYGVMQGAAERGADIVETAVDAVEGAREAAYILGIAEEKVMGYAVEGVLTAVSEINPGSLARVKKALPEKIMEMYKKHDTGEK
jgi:MFS family permease